MKHHHQLSNCGCGSQDHSEEIKIKPIVNSIPKIGRNEPCPCASGKKFKQCHGGLTKDLLSNKE